MRAWQGRPRCSVARAAARVTGAVGRAAMSPPWAPCRPCWSQPLALSPSLAARGSPRMRSLCVAKVPWTGLRLVPGRRRRSSSAAACQQQQQPDVACACRAAMRAAAVSLWRPWQREVRPLAPPRLANGMRAAAAARSSAAPAPQLRLCVRGQLAWRAGSPAAYPAAAGTRPAGRRPVIHSVTAARAARAEGGRTAAAVCEVAVTGIRGTTRPPHAVLCALGPPLPRVAP